MRTVFVVVAVALILAAAAFAQEYEPNWGKKIQVFRGDEEVLIFHGENALSPDGSEIAVSLNDGVYLVDAESGSASLIYQNEDNFQKDFENTYRDLCFTPDGEEITIAYLTSEIIREGLGNHIIACVNLTTGEYRDLTTGWTPKWNSSDRYFLCKRYADIDGTKNETLVVIDTDTGTETTLIAIPWKPGYIAGHSFFPDESAVVFSTNYSFEREEAEDFIYSLYRIPLTGGEPERIALTDEYDDRNGFRMPEIHPDGIHAVVRIGMMIAFVNMETGTVEPLTPDDEEYGFIYNKLSFDGTKVSFVRQPRTSDFTVNELRILELGELLEGGFQTAVESDTPTVFPTLASYPNPFNPVTTISFTLPASGFAELAVYNLTGQKIRTLIGGELSPGVHEVVWDGCDDSGDPVSSGIFVSRLAAGENVVTNRMMLVK